MASINNWPPPDQQADSAPQRSEGGGGMILQFSLTSVTVRGSRTVPVVGGNGQPVQYSSDPAEVTPTFVPASGFPMFTVDVQSENENEAIAAALSKLAALAGSIAEIEVRRRGAEARYRINGADGAAPKVVAL